MDRVFQGFNKIERIEYYEEKNEIVSDVYLNQELDSVVIIDRNIYEMSYLGAFSYREYINHQNRLMKNHKYLYRFLERDLDENREKILKILGGEMEIPPVPNKKITREGVDASYLEHHFEKIFFDLYGTEAYNLLTKEEGLIGFNGENIFADYVIEKRMRR